MRWTAVIDMHVSVHRPWLLPCAELRGGIGRGGGSLSGEVMSAPVGTQQHSDYNVHAVDLSRKLGFGMTIYVEAFILSISGILLKEGGDTHISKEYKNIRNTTNIPRLKKCTLANILL